jgi:hypothetical protein
MEKLEVTLKKVELKGKDSRPLRDKSLYKGLRLVEDVAYDGGTSIKYWM